MQKSAITSEPIEGSLLINEREKLIKVCAYCRVSTDKKDQANSFEAQKGFFEREFEYHPNWTIKTIFADKGISGTSYKKRDEFNHMICEATKGNYDLIVTKGVARFSRNVLDILSIVEDLRKRGVFIWFMTENIYTEKPDYREALIKASEQAEAESRNTSIRVKWGQRYQMQRGVVFGRKEMYGYNIKRDELGKQYFEIIPDEAEIIRRIFTMYLNGMGTFKIARQLESEGIKTKRYKNGWSNTVILRILRNEKYVGDLLQGKTYTPDYLTHEKKSNRGMSATHFIENNHPEQAIVSRELWNSVQARLKETEPSEETKSKHSNRYWCSGKVFCGECGERFVSHIRKLQKDNIHKSWKCWAHLQYGTRKTKITENGEERVVGCDSHSVNDKVLKQGIYDILFILIKPIMEKNFNAVKKLVLQRGQKDDNSKKVEKLNKRLARLNDEYAELTRQKLAKTISQMAYDITSKQIENEMRELNTQMSQESDELSKSNLIHTKATMDLENLRRIIELRDDEISDDVFRSAVDRIEVFNDNIIKYYIYGWYEPFVLRYKTKGRLDSYTVEFEALEE